MSDFFDDLGATENGTTKRAQRRTRSAEVASVRKRKRIRTAVISGILVMLLTAAVVILLPQITSLFGGEKAVSDYPGPGTGDVTVVIPEGATGRDMAEILHDSGVVATSKSFVDAFNSDPRAASIQPGTYKLRSQMSAAGAVTALLDPANKADLKVTIPEGYTTWQVYDRLGKILGVDSADVKAAAEGDIGLPAEANGNPEGWFAPLTYTLEPGTTPAQALSQMVAKRVEQLESLGISRDTWESTLIMASIVEREGNTTDYSKVARVILNREDETSESVGLLQMDSTVLYGLGLSGGVPTRAQLETDTPYNTYIHKGLPPTPISNPSVDAIKATLNPEPGNWLYFVTVNLDTGETKFSATLAEHDQYVQQFKEWCAANSGKCG